MLVFPPGGEARLILSFAHRQRLRLELYIDTGDGEENEKVLASLEEQQSALETRVGQRLSWEKLEKRRACRVALYVPGSILEASPELESLTVENGVRFYHALAAPLREAFARTGAAKTVAP